ncbi:MAG: S1C family serine protease [Rubrivivax sp.]
MSTRVHPRLRFWLALLAALLMSAPLRAADDPAREAQSRALERAANAVVGLQARAVDGARSAGTLGRARQGSGVVIDADGLVLTIGYLVLEADQVLLVTDDDRRIPARVIAYDQATGFGLVRALAPLKLEPVPLGRAKAIGDEQPLMVASGGEAGAVSAVRLVSRRVFAGYWEYLLEDALFTAPARPDHSGAGLFNERGELVGIGSLVVSDAAGNNRRQSGNMFVPIDLLSPILPELLARGRSQQSDRAWMGINAVESEGRVRVMRVTEDSPADVAGVEPGDHIVSLDGQPVASVEALWKALWRGTGSARAVQLQVEREGRPQQITVHTVDRSMTLKRSEGV